MQAVIAGMLKNWFNPGWLAVALLCMSSVMTLTHLPQDPTPESLKQGFFHIDKAEHVLAYGVITLLFILALRRPVQMHVFLLVLAGVAVIGLLDELTQPLMGRVCGATDYIANVIGILLCAVISARSVLSPRG